jgi:hypothetical protein
MDKDYLLEEIIGGLEDLAPMPKTLIIQSVNEQDKKLMKTLDETEMTIEHVASCIVAYRKLME